MGNSRRRLLFSQLRGDRKKLSSEKTRLRGRAGCKRRQRILKRDNYQCKLCGKVLPITDLIVDHIVPLAHGGSDTDENLQTLCKEDSDRKTETEMGNRNGHVIRYDVRKRRSSNLMHSNPSMVGDSRSTQGSGQDRLTTEDNNGDVRKNEDYIY